jgi:hypothetical protein
VFVRFPSCGIFTFSHQPVPFPVKQRVETTV